MIGPCAKRRVIAHMITPDFEHYMGENLCMNPQTVCPREEGEGYEKCKSVCQQICHAEIMVLHQAGDKAKGAIMRVTHEHMCRDCKNACIAAGLHSVSTKEHLYVFA